MNLSSRSLSDAEVSLLEKGSRTNIPATKIVAKVELVIGKLDSEKADTVKRTVNKNCEQCPITC